VILRLEAGQAETMRFEDADLMGAKGPQLRRLRARLQVVPQHPTTSLNPRLKVSESIAFNLRAHGYPRSERNSRIAGLLDRVGLATQHADSYPHELSGGQLQRAAT